MNDRSVIRNTKCLKYSFENEKCHAFCDVNSVS